MAPFGLFPTMSPEPQSAARMSPLLASAFPCDLTTQLPLHCLCSGRKKDERGKGAWNVAILFCLRVLVMVFVFESSFHLFTESTRILSKYRRKSTFFFFFPGKKQNCQRPEMLTSQQSPDRLPRDARRFLAEIVPSLDSPLLHQMRTPCAFLQSLQLSRFALFLRASISATRVSSALANGFVRVRAPPPPPPPRAIAVSGGAASVPRGRPDDVVGTVVVLVGAAVEDSAATRDRGE
ncbi:hypothetical protein IWX49DRAFT_561213 [Phyllosticta citricarpa]